MLVYTFLTSVATGVTFNGIGFINDTAFGYGLGMNSALGVLLGITYIVGAMGTGPFIRWLQRRFAWCSPRAVLVLMMISAALLNAFPVTVWFITPAEARHNTQWAMWTYIALYSLLCGGLWPIVEAFLSGGRSAAFLPRAIGIFNVTWSSALVVSMVMIAFIPWLIDQASGSGSSLSDADKKVLTLAAMALVHIGSIGLLWFFGQHPGEHAHDEHTYPDNYPELLRLHRGLMPVIYTICYALSPFLPDMTKAIGVTGYWAAPLSAIWLLARPITFFIMDHWQGWHGTRFNAWVGGLCTFIGFACCVLAAIAGAGALGMSLAIFGLITFGVGAAIVYVAALYYAMKVGAAAVDEGGKHEALIGMGYTVGPMCGLGAVGLSSLGWIAASAVNPAMLILVTLAAGSGVAATIRRK